MNHYEFKSSPSIDNDSYFDIIERAKSREIEGAKTYLSRSKNINFLGVLSFNKANFDVSNSINETEPIVGKHTPTYNTLLNLKNGILRRGFMKYEEAYSIAFKYLRENPNLKELFSKRFPLVFIDEMQDMETHQSELINYLCNGTSTIVQKIGDINQSIYNYSSTDNQNEWKPKINSELQLNETRRHSENIVEVVKDICVAPQEMKGWTNQNPVKPTIIVYENCSIHNVKDKFGELLILNNLNNDRLCKAIGARLSDSRLNINSYWNEFNRGYNKIDFSNLNSYLENIKQLSSKSKNVKDTRKSLLSIFCKCLRLCKIKNPKSVFYFTPYTLVQFINSHEDIS